MFVSEGKTRERLILAGERVFAERGVGAASLREIGVAAGQRNTAAAQYHFGTKEALIAAIFEYRMTAINARRLEMLARAQADGRAGDLRSMLEAYVFPLAESIAAGGKHYGRFMAQLYAVPGFRSSFDWENAESLRLVWRGITRCLAGVPRPVVTARLRMLTHLTVHAMADHEPPARATVRTPPRWALDLVDAAEGLLTATVSCG
jgi:AcrR family transcriptional regulator